MFLNVAEALVQRKLLDAIFHWHNEEFTIKVNLEFITITQILQFCEIVVKNIALKSFPSGLSIEFAKELQMEILVQ